MLLLLLGEDTVGDDDAIVSEAVSVGQWKGGISPDDHSLDFICRSPQGRLVV